MLSSRLLAGVRQVPAICKRNIGLCAPASQKASDPIQQLFIDKIREYKQKSSGKQLLEPSPEIEKELKSELERTARVYGKTDGVNMEEFPTFNFKEPTLDPISVQQK